MHIAVVGAGPVGIFFTKLCLDEGHTVTLIESGGLHQESNLLNRRNYVFKSPSAMPDGVHTVGGGSTQWRGRLSEFLDEDFFEWPFAKKELSRHYLKLYKLLNIGEVTDDDILNKFWEKEPFLLPKELKLRSFRFCKSDYFIKLFQQIRNHNNLEILLGTFAIKVNYLKANNSTSIELLHRNFSISSREFSRVVITCGSLQSAAILLRSKQLINSNSATCLGKNLMEHCEGYIGSIKIKDPAEKEIFKKLSLNEANRAIDDYEGVGVALSLRPNRLESSSWLNVQFEIRSFMPKPFIFQRFLKSRSINSKRFLMIINFFLFVEKSLSFVIRRTMTYLNKLVGIEKFSIYVKSEELPYSESYVRIEDTSDNMLIYHHKVSHETYQLLTENLFNFKKIFESHFKAKLKYYKGVQSIASIGQFFGPNWHPMGVAKMGLDQKTSICDENLKIRGINNVYLLSAAVFPSGSNTNPTFTVLALASRLIESEFSRH